MSEIVTPTSKKIKSPPYSYYQDMLVNSRYSPSMIHTKDTRMYNYFMEYLIQRAISIFEWDGIPDNWDMAYLLYHLFCEGWISVISTDKYGVIPQKCTLTGRNIYDLPSRIIVTNELLPDIRELRIDEQCALIKLMPNYGNIMNICGVYADMLSCCLETASVSLMNSKMAYVFFAENKASAETFKKLYDKLSAGEPMAVIDKSLFNADGSKNWDYFIQNVGQNYIAGDVLNDMRTLINMFNTEIGIRNANTQKRERLISDEVNANNEETKSKVLLWLDEVKKGVDVANRLFDLAVEVRYRYDDDQEGVITDDTGED